LKLCRIFSKNGKLIVLGLELRFVKGKVEVERDGWGERRMVGLESRIKMGFKLKMKMKMRNNRQGTGCC
jgi:hypothetical protein